MQFVWYSVTEARDADGKRKVQKRESKFVFDIKPEAKMTFDELTGWYTGMCKGEILNLTWDKVDLANRMIRLEAKDTKDKEKRNIPICDELFNMLVSLSNRIQETNEDNHVFLYNGSPVKDIRVSLKRACKRAGIKYGRFVEGGFIFHDLRHTFNTNMRKAGVSESVIMDITGHSTR